jgi:hypothetical protein
MFIIGWDKKAIMLMAVAAATLGTVPLLPLLPIFFIKASSTFKIEKGSFNYA